ncbi:unnamed protein product [Rotaria sordida]|uniref:Uncharacterized protein n=1 Tax=Rotaria sordida TaxID=392033 RepID=A0A819WQM2_9BILA|nr:unnamed protein product [Rotaria sordida]
MSQGKKRIHHIMLSSDSETSDDESQYRTRANTIHMEGSNYEGSNLNNTVVSNMINEINELTDQNTRNQRTASTFNTSLNIVNIASTSPIQTSIEQYFATTDNLFHEINRLNENTSEFRIRCKVLYKSLIRQFGANSKMFDGIVCDMYEEIKVIAFDEQVDRLYNLMNINQKIIIENGQVRKADERYRTTNSMYEIRLFENSHVELYESNDFNPSIDEIPDMVLDQNIRIRRGSNKSTAIGLIERATREVEEYLQIKIEDSRINGSVTIESLLHELEKKRSIIQAFDEFNTFASSFSLYRADKAVYHRSVLNTLWNGPKSYFRQLVKGDIKCENPWLSIVAAAHPSAIINILKEENNQLGADGLFARFIFSARISPEDVHKRSKRDTDATNGELYVQPSAYPSLSHIMYFIYLMHDNQTLTLKMSQAANDILTHTHDEYNNMVIGFQGYQDVLCTLFSKSRDHLYRICGLVHLLHQACTYVLKAEPQLQYLVLDDIAAESIQRVASIARESMNDYLIIQPEVALTTVELMKFYVDTKKLLYGFPLITIPPSQGVNVGPSASQRINTSEQHVERDNCHPYHSIVNNTSRSVVSHYSGFSSLSSSIDPFNGSTTDATIKKILLYKKQTITGSRLCQILREFNISPEEYENHLQSSSETSITTTGNTTSTITNTISTTNN